MPLEKYDGRSRIILPRVEFVQPRRHPIEQGAQADQLIEPANAPLRLQQGVGPMLLTFGEQELAIRHITSLADRTRWRPSDFLDRYATTVGYHSVADLFGPLRSCPPRRLPP